jgi:hypothetical protein
VCRETDSSSKRTGLEKAIHQVEQALKRSKSNGVTFDPDADVDLRQLVDKAAEQDTDQPKSSSFAAPQHLFPNPDHLHPDAIPAAPLMPEATVPEHYEKPDALALDNADNPLQLLAMASALPNQSPTAVITPSPAAPTSLTESQSLDPEDAELQRFFGSLTPVLDNTADIDPVELGLVTEDEADTLFKYFYDLLPLQLFCRQPPHLRNDSQHTATTSLSASSPSAIVQSRLFLPS